jgi:hypothetical protein
MKLFSLSAALLLFTSSAFSYYTYEDLIVAMKNSPEVAGILDEVQETYGVECDYSFKGVTISGAEIKTLNARCEDKVVEHTFDQMVLVHFKVELSNEVLKVLKYKVLQLDAQHNFIEVESSTPDSSNEISN